MESSPPWKFRNENEELRVLYSNTRFLVSLMISTLLITNFTGEIMIEMTLEIAEKIAKAAHKKASQIKKPMSVSVVDESGRLVYFSRADNAGFFTFDTSRAKAMAAASFKRSTMEITEQKDANPLLWYSLPSVVPAQALPSPGGLPIFRDNHLIGGIGIGGGSPQEDHESAIAGAASVK